MSGVPRQGRRRTTRMAGWLPWTLSVLFGCCLGIVLTLVLQRVHDRYAAGEGHGWWDFLRLEFFVGDEGCQDLGVREGEGGRVEEVSLAFRLHENAYLDLLFRKTDRGGYAVRLSGSHEMPSAFLKRLQGRACTGSTLTPRFLAPGEWHRLRLRLDGEGFEAWLDGRRAGEYRDGEFAAGSLGLSSGFAMVELDDVEVSGVRVPEGAPPERFRIHRANPFRRNGIRLLLIAGTILFFVLERWLLTRGPLLGRKGGRALSRGLLPPLVLTLAAFPLTLLPRLALLAAAGVLWMVSRIRLLLGLASPRLKALLPAGARRAGWIALSAVLLLVLASFLLRTQRIRGEGEVAVAGEDRPAPVDVELNVPFVPAPATLQNFRWTFDVLLGEGSVAEVVVRKREDDAPVVRPCGEGGRYWYAFVLSSHPELASGFAKITDLDRYAKKEAEEPGGPLPAGQWLPVVVEARGDALSCRVGDGRLGDRMRDGDLVSGRCGVSLIRGAVRVRNSSIRVLDPTDRLPSRLSRMLGGGGVPPPRHPLRSPPPVDGLAWYLRTPYRYENTLLQDQTFRGRRFRQRKPPGTTRIVCIGGSSTYGLMLPEGSGADYPHVLERMLNGRPGDPRFEVINAAVIGTYSRRSVEYLREVLLPFDPDLVLVNLTWNDNIIPTIVEDGYAAYRAHLAGWRRSPLVAPFLYVGEWVGFARRGARFVERAKAGRPGGVVINPDNLPRYERNLHALIDVAEQAGGRIGLILEPSTDVLVYPRGMELLSPLHDVQRRVAGERGILLVDPLERFREERYADLFYDVMHLTPFGHRLLASILQESLHRRWPEIFPVPLTTGTCAAPPSRADRAAR